MTEGHFCFEQQQQVQSRHWWWLVETDNAVSESVDRAAQGVYNRDRNILMAGRVRESYF